MSEWQPDFLTAGTGLSVWFAQENKAKVLGFYDLISQVIQSHCHHIRFLARTQRSSWVYRKKTGPPHRKGYIKLAC